MFTWPRGCECNLPGRKITMILQIGISWAWITREQAAAVLIWTDFISFGIEHKDLNKASSFQRQSSSLHYKQLLPKSLIWKDPKHDNISCMINTNFDVVTLPQKWDEQEFQHWFLLYLLFFDQALKKIELRFYYFFHSVSTPFDSWKARNSVATGTNVKGLLRFHIKMMTVTW